LQYLLTLLYFVCEAAKRERDSERRRSRERKFKKKIKVFKLKRSIASANYSTFWLGGFKKKEAPQVLKKKEALQSFAKLRRKRERRRASHLKYNL